MELPAECERALMRFLREPEDLARWGMVSRYHRDVVRALPPEHALLLHGGERLREGIDPRKLLLLPVDRALKCAAGICELCGKKAHFTKISRAKSAVQLPSIFPSLSLYAHAKCLQAIAVPAKRIRDACEAAEVEWEFPCESSVQEIEEGEEEEVNFADEETLVKLVACRTPSVELGTAVRFSRIACEGYEVHRPDNWESTHTVFRTNYVDELHPLLRPTWTVEGVEGQTLEQCEEEGRKREPQVQEEEARRAAVIQRLAPRLREQESAVKRDPPPFLGDPFDGVPCASYLRRFQASSNTTRMSRAMSEGDAMVVAAACKRAGMTAEYKNHALHVRKPATAPSAAGGST